MCQQNKMPLSAGMVKLVMVLAMVLFAECAAGSCLSYGHACWGAHGKRSGAQASPSSRLENGALSSKDEAKAEWFLSKLISPLDLRYYREDLDAAKSQPDIEELFMDPEAENNKSGNDWEKIRDVLRNDGNYLSIENGRGVDTYLKKPKFLNKRSPTKEQ